MFHELCHFVKAHSLYIPPTQCNYYANHTAFLKTYSESSFDFSDAQFTLWMNILHLPHAFFAQCSFGLYLFIIFIISINYGEFSLFQRHYLFLITLSLNFYLSTICPFFVRDYINHKVFEKVEPYLKLLDPLLCVNLLVTCVLQYLFKTVLCWMQFKAKAVKWPVREFIQLFTEGQQGN